jgi:hypothetical protein
MDCEKFDQHLIDALYDELDELTHAAMKRHMDGCARCASSFSGLRATRDVALMPLEEPSDDLEDRILAAVEVAQRRAPWRRKALRALAWAGSHAMRPQLAMAALFVLVIGSSLLLLRARPGTHGVAPVRVTERGMPAPEQPDPDPVAPAPAPPPEAAATPVAAAELSDGKAAEDKAKDDSAAQEKGKARDTAEGADAASVALKEAQAARASSGCAAALGLYDEVGTRYPGTAAAHTAMWEAARCHREAGDEAKARELLMALRSVDSYKSQAEAELASAEANANMQVQNALPPAATGGKLPPVAAAAPAAGAAAGKAAAAAPARPKAAPKPAPAQADDAYDDVKPGAPAGQGLSSPARRSTQVGY